MPSARCQNPSPAPLGNGLPRWEKSKPAIQRGPESTRLEWLPRFGFLQGLGSVFNVFGMPEIDARRYSASCDRMMLTRDMVVVSADLRRVARKMMDEQPRLFNVDELLVSSRGRDRDA
jgi:hypothetical protein